MSTAKMSPFIGWFIQAWLGEEPLLKLKEFTLRLFVEIEWQNRNLWNEREKNKEREREGKWERENERNVEAFKEIKPQELLAFWWYYIIKILHNILRNISRLKLGKAILLTANLINRFTVDFLCIWESRDEI